MLMTNRNPSEVGICSLPIKERIPMSRTGDVS
jgi:hypothetical protein